jgi:two-component system, cell cycle response regulator
VSWLAAFLPIAAVVLAIVALAIACAGATAAIAEATHDGLTGLMVPRAFRRLLSKEISRAQRSHSACIALWFVDADSFKRINDGYGHRTGDAVLVALSLLLRAHLRCELDIAARHGGDEFCAMLRGASKSSAIGRAQQFCDTIRAHDFGFASRVTVSVGVATFPDDAASANALLEAADAAMYRSKRNGGDRVSFAAEAASSPPRTSVQWRSNGDESYAE